MVGTVCAVAAVQPELPGVEPPRRNLLDRVIDRVDALQRRTAPIAVVHAVLKKHGEDRGGQLAVLLAYRGFFSVFPLLLAFVSVMGLLLAGNDELREELVDSALGSVPVIGNEILAANGEVTGSVVVVVGSILVSLWAGLGLLEMLQEALNTVWGVPIFERPPWIIRRLRSVPAALLVGACLVISSGRWALRAAPDVVASLGAIVFPVGAGVICTIGLHRLLCARQVELRGLLPGALLSGVSWWALQGLAEWFIDRFVVRSSDTYGVFVIVFGLLSWSYLLGLLYLYGNELSSVLADRRWPRSLSGRDLTDADRIAFAAVAEREVRVRGTEIEVEVPRDPAPG
jgi:membrane protein